MSEIFNAFNKHKPIIKMTVAKYCSRSADHEDLVQEVFIKAFACELKESIQNPKAFLLTLAKNISISHGKKHAHSKTDYLEDSTDLETLIDRCHPSPEDAYKNKRRLFILTQTLAHLKPEYSVALLMRKVEHLKFSQIATRLDISTQAAEKRVARALIACKTHLKEQGYDLLDLGIFNPPQGGDNMPPKSAGKNEQHCEKDKRLK